MADFHRHEFEERLREPRKSRDLRQTEKPSEWIERILKEARDG